MTANEFTNVKDIKKNFLYTRDGYVMCFLKISFYNIDLLSKEEKRSKTAALAASFEGDRKDFAYFTYPREIDLDVYKSDLKDKYNAEMTSLGRRHLLAELIVEATELATNGENYEHQHFIKLWKRIAGGRQDAESELQTRAEEFKARYESTGIPVEILKESDILKMCNLFGNSLQAAFEIVDANTYETIPKIK